jgi:hypothetical protein
MHTNPNVVFTTPGDYVCDGSSVVMNIANSGITALWSNGANTTSAQVSPTVTTVYGATITSQFGCTASAAHTVIVWPKPQLNINSNSPVCLGNSVTLQVNGAATYTWNNGFFTSLVSFIPFSSAVYTVIGKDANGCVNSTTTSVVLNPLPVIQNGNNSSTVCLGSGVPLWVTTQGAATYFWSTGANTQTITVSPLVNSVYNVTVVSPSGCKSSAAQLVSVLPLPWLQLGLSNDFVCAGEGVDILPLSNNYIAYLWSNGAQTQSVTVYPVQTTSYSLTATGLNGCSSVAAISVTVNECTGLTNQMQNKNTLKIYPNPSNGNIVISSKNQCTPQFYDETGRLIRSIELNERNGYTLNLTNFSKGIYFVKSGSGIYKLMVE